MQKDIVIINLLVQDANLNYVGLMQIKCFSSGL